MDLKLPTSFLKMSRQATTQECPMWTGVMLTVALGNSNDIVVTDWKTVRKTHILGLQNESHS